MYPQRVRTEEPRLEELGAEEVKPDEAMPDEAMPTPKQVEPRPEEIIAEVCRQISIKRGMGEKPVSVVMNLNCYRQLNWYRRFLGVLKDNRLDYLGQFSIFGLDILIDKDCSSPSVL